MRRIWMTGLMALLVVAGALPAAAAPPVAEDVIVFTVADGTGSLTATANGLDGVGTVTLDGSAEVSVDCDGASLLLSITWSGTFPATFDLHPNGSSGTVTVAAAEVDTEDCYGNPVTETMAFTATFDTDPGADRWRDESGNRVVSRTGTGTLTFGPFAGVAASVSAERTYLSGASPARGR